MKNKLLILSLFSFLLIHSQEKNKVAFGIKLGPNLSKFSSNTFVDFQYKLGFFAGGYLNLELSEKIKLQPELLYINKGTTLFIEEIEITEPESEPRIEEFKTNINENSISIPIIIQYYATDKLYFETGPQLGYIISRNEKIKENPFGDLVDFVDITDSFEDDIDFSLGFGTGYELIKNLRLNIRYFFSLIERDNAIKDSGFYFGADLKL